MSGFLLFFPFFLTTIKQQQQQNIKLYEKKSTFESSKHGTWAARVVFGSLSVTSCQKGGITCKECQLSKCQPAFPVFHWYERPNMTEAWAAEIRSTYTQKYFRYINICKATTGSLQMEIFAQFLLLFKEKKIG